jgi:UDP-N-acetylmuramate dehydrogenase
MTNDIEIIEHADLKPFNTYHLPSKAKYLVKPKTKEELISLITYLKNNHLNYFIMGNGSNIILPNKEFNGYVIVLTAFKEYKITNNYLTVDAGAMLPVIANASINANLKGLEWAIGIPGTIGGAVYNNAGAYLDQIMNYVEEVEFLTNDLKIITYKYADISYGYRTTMFKEQKKGLILSIKLKLMPGNQAESLLLVADRRKRRMASQPLDKYSAGSVFRNPSPEMPAGKLIEEANLKGKSIGGAEISSKHANFIINKGNATSDDVISLINVIKKTIKQKDNIDLVCEQEIVEWP